MNEYVFVNKNPILPEIIHNCNFEIALSQLANNTLNKNSVYCKNIYVIELDKNEIVQLYFSNSQQVIYSLNKFNKIKQHKNKIIDLHLIDKFLTKQNFISSKSESNEFSFNTNTSNNEKETEVSNFKQNFNCIDEEFTTNEFKENDNKTNHNETIVVNNKLTNTYNNDEFTTNEFKSNEFKSNEFTNEFKTNEFKTGEKSVINNIKKISVNNESDENKNVFDDCKMLMNKYNKEIERKNAIREKLKIFEKEEKELLNKQKGLIQDKIVTLYGKFKTYINIKTDREKGICKNTDIFKLEYEYFENMNLDDVNFLKTINDNDIMNKEKYDDRLIELSEQFKKNFQKDIKKSNFEHNWKELEDEVVIGTFNAKCGN
jgi:hypothetical protein